MIILGLNAYHGDSSACIVVDGQLIAAVEEERFRRIKHWAGFPSESITYCLKEAGMRAGDIEPILVSRNSTGILAVKEFLVATAQKKVFRQQGYLKRYVYEKGRLEGSLPPDH
jgi:predicted NodU family carbamoyl transferase